MPWEKRPETLKERAKRKLAEREPHKGEATTPDPSPCTEVQGPEPRPKGDTPPSRHSNAPKEKVGNVRHGKEPPHPARTSLARYKESPSSRLLPKQGRAEPGGKGSAAFRNRSAVKRPAAFLRQRAKRGAAAKTASQTAQTVHKTAKPAVTVTKKLAHAAGRAVAAMVKGLIAFLGGGVFLAVVLVIVIAGALISSPFGILFSSQDHSPGTVPVSQAVGQINREFSTILDGLQSGNYDSVILIGEPAEWPDVLAVFAVKTALYDGENAADVVTLDQDRVDRLKAVYWDMSPVHTWVEEIYHPPTLEEPAWIEYILHLTIGAKTPEEMAEHYRFNRQQKEALAELLAERELLAELIGNLTINDGDAAQVVEDLPADLDPARRAAVMKALELVGKVSYFWGGKSYGIGWDSRWGTLVEVTAPGSSTTGQYLPYGLDCTGLLDWAFRNAGLPSAGNWYLERNLTETTWEEAKPGDIALFPDDSHVALVVGRDESGNVLVVHCSYSLNTVAVSPARSFGFTKVGTPNIYGG